MSRSRLKTILRRLKDHPVLVQAPVHRMKDNHRADPFRTLVSVVLSSRTQDDVTIAAVERLMAVAPTPRRLMELDEATIAKLIYPVGFYRTKARHLKQLSRILVERFDGCVPDRFEDLVKLPGVGRKTANLVLSEAFGRATIAVDTHVHRISNRLGLVQTQAPEATEAALKKITPVRDRSDINHWFVALGQTICRPLRPRCEVCPLADLCPRIGVEG